MIGKIIEAIDTDPGIDQAEKLKLKEAIRARQEKSLSPKDEESLWRRLRDASQAVWEFSVPILQAILTAEAKKRLGLPP